MCKSYEFDGKGFQIETNGQKSEGIWKERQQHSKLWKEPVVGMFLVQCGKNGA